MKYADYWKQNCNSWRDTGDSADTWEAVKKNLFTCDEWVQHCSPGHFYDQDMLETGYIFNHDINDFRASALTENEQLTAFSIRVMFPSPLRISCDLSTAD